MSPSNEASKSGGPLQSILVAVVVALIAGGSSPWWFTAAERMFSHSHPYMSELEPGRNRRGSDISKTEASSASDCAQICLNNNDCKAMAFEKHREAKGGTCWQKNKVPDSDANPDMTSSVKKYK
jgi:hypothetical protein